MYFIFHSCFSLVSIDLSNFNTKNTYNINYLFYNCRSLVSVNISSFNTENVISMSYLFQGCNSLTSIDLSNFNTKKASNMNYLFYNCNNLTYVDISSFVNGFNTSLHLFNHNLPKNGNLKINNEFYNSIKDNIGISNWTIEFIDV